jgi:hypothetical protein
MNQVKYNFMKIQRWMLTIAMALGSTFVAGACALDVPEADPMMEQAVQRTEGSSSHELDQPTGDDFQTLVTCPPRWYLDPLVERLYNIILGRPSDLGGKNFWLDEIERLCGLDVNVREFYRILVKIFFSSAEYAARYAAYPPANRNTLFVQDLYRACFDRELDTGGNSYWLGQIRDGLNRDAVLVSFIKSLEFEDYLNRLFSPFGSPSRRAESSLLTDLYRGVLVRMPDIGGFLYWRGRLRAAQCSGYAAVASEARTVVDFFFNLPEYVNRGRTDAEYVADLYDVFVPGMVDPGGFNFWVGQVPVWGRQGVRDYFFASPEWAARLAKIAAEPCMPQP